MVQKEVLVSFLKFPGIVMGHSMTYITLSGNIVPKMVLGGMMECFGKINFFGIFSNSSRNFITCFRH